jgi:hypothetical protein
MFNELQDKQTSYQLPSNITIMAILISMATYFGPSDHHLATSQKRNLGPCSAIM